jgi:hypothetical protein
MKTKMHIDKQEMKLQIWLNETDDLKSWTVTYKEVQLSHLGIGTAT